MRCEVWIILSIKASAVLHLGNIRFLYGSFHYIALLGTFAPDYSF